MKLTRKIHRVAGYIVGLQLLLWLISGLYFNLSDSDIFQSKNYYRRIAPVQIKAEQLININDKIARHQATDMTIVTIIDQPYVALNSASGSVLYHAYLGSKLAVTQALAEQIATVAYSGSGEITSSVLIEDGETFAKIPFPVWQVNFSDEVASFMLINQQNGQIEKYSDQQTRLRDFFFMLHFMDYQQHGGFNNWQIILFAFACVWLTISGLILAIKMTYKLFNRKSAI